MQPLVSTKGKTAQLRYDLPQRIHDAHVYPVKAPNGSTVLLYGHETGVGILWRGGRPLKSSPQPVKKAAKPSPKVNGTSRDAIMIISSDEDEPPKKAPAPTVPKAEFEDEEEELDPDQPYPSFIQHIRLALSAEVLHIAVPRVPAVSALRPADSIPAIFRNKIVFTVACADYSVRVVTLPLSPPPNSAKEAPLSPQSQFGEEIFKVPSHVGHQSIPRGIDLTWTSRTEPVLDEESDDEMEIDGRPQPSRQHSSSRARNSEGWDLLVASHSTEVGGLLKIWRFNLSETAVSAPAPISAYQTLSLRHPASKIAFNSAQYPRSRHSQLLITDGSGTARIYDPFTIPSRKRRTSGAEQELGGYVALFRTGFEGQSNTFSPPALASRKPIIDAVWASDGNSILALLAGGEWGIWDVSRTGPKPPSDPSAFSARGFVVTSEESRSSSAPSPKSNNSRGSLAPMTPNTRRTKEEKLFSSGSSGPSISPRGGVSIASLQGTNGSEPEESALIWYGADAYRIPNFAQFWSRNTAGSDNNAFLKPALSQIQGLNLHGEAITSVDQFDTTTKDARMAIPRDVLVSTDHRLIIVTQVAQPLGRNMDTVFEKEDEEEAITRKTDQALLRRGELDLGGMDRLLEEMDGDGSGKQSLMLGNPRRVLFASSTGA